MRQIFFDTETTGLDAKAGHRIISLALIEHIDGKPTGLKKYYLFDPERDIDPEAQKIHGISREQLVGKPKFAELADEIEKIIAGSELVAHNIKFDLSFMNEEYKKVGRTNRLQDITSGTLDTMDCSKRLFPKKQHNLNAFCKNLDVDITRRDVHNALVDTEMLADAFLSLGQKFPKFNPRANPFFDNIEREPIQKLTSKPANLRVVLASSEELGRETALFDKLKPKDMKMKV